MEKLIIAAAICGAEVTKEHNPAVPYTVDEIVREERAVHIACLYHSQFYGTLLCHRL